MKQEAPQGLRALGGFAVGYRIWRGTRIGNSSGPKKVSIAYRAIQNGFEARFSTAAQLIEELSNAARTGRLASALHDYLHPHVLVIDEIGYLSLRAVARA